MCVLALGLTPYIKVEAQVTRNGNEFVSTKKSTKKEPIKTNYVYVDSDGKKYPIYISATGKAFIWKVSKKSGKKYKKYLPEVTKELQKQGQK